MVECCRGDVVIKVGNIQVNSTPQHSTTSTHLTYTTYTTTSDPASSTAQKTSKRQKALCHEKFVLFLSSKKRPKNI